MTNFKQMQLKIAKWEDRAQRPGPCSVAKRAVPEWLQPSLENQGLVFDPAGQVLSATGCGSMQIPIGEGGPAWSMPADPANGPARTPSPSSGRGWKYEPLASAQKFHALGTRYRGFSGPIGSGKSYAFAYEALFQAYLNLGLMGLIGAPTYPMLRDTTQRTFFEILEREQIGFAERKTENAIVLSDNGSYIAFRSLDNFERLRGTNLAWFGVDELTYAKPEAWSRLEGRLRDSRAYRRCGFAAWTPKGFDHVWEKFIDQPGPDYAAVQALPRENPYVTETGFYDFLERSYERRLYEQEVEGKYLSIHSGTVYYAFEAAHNVQRLTYNPREPLCWALDFNVDPMCSVICQIEDRTTHADMMMGYKNVRLNVLDEIVLPDSNLGEVCNEFARRARDLVGLRRIEVRIYGDPAGSARSHAGNSDWEIVRQILNREGIDYSMHVASSHAAVKDRVNAVNSMLHATDGVRRLLLDTGCNELRKDLQQVVWKADAAGNLTNDIDKSDRRRTHISDALGYLVEEEFGLKGFAGFRPERIF